MYTRLALAAAAAIAIAAPAQATTQPAQKVELTKMMGRWYEVARVPNALQKGCTAGASEWRPAGQGFAVVQSCHKGSPDGPVKEWKAKATVADPGANTRFKMSFFGGVVSQEYQVYAHSPEQGWIVLGASNGKYLWLMSQKPVLPAPVRAQAISRIRQLGFDPARLEFPAAAGN
jgi:apolipoprotein D and lipocalin family protein